MFHIYLGDCPRIGACDRSLCTHDAAALKNARKGPRAEGLRRCMLAHGADIQGAGGMLSSAHSHADVARTAEISRLRWESRGSEAAVRQELCVNSCSAGSYGLSSCSGHFHHRLRGDASLRRSGDAPATAGRDQGGCRARHASVGPGQAPLDPIPDLLGQSDPPRLRDRLFICANPRFNIVVERFSATLERPPPRPCSLCARPADWRHWPPAGLNSWVFDNSAMPLAAFGQAAPTFFVGIIPTLTSSSLADIFPTSGRGRLPPESWSCLRSPGRRRLGQHRPRLMRSAMPRGGSARTTSGLREPRVFRSA